MMDHKLLTFFTTVCDFNAGNDKSGVEANETVPPNIIENKLLQLEKDNVHPSKPPDSTAKELVAFGRDNFLNLSLVDFKAAVIEESLLKYRLLF